MRTSSRQMLGRLRWALLASVVGLSLSIAASPGSTGGPMPRFTGYTRVGYVPEAIEGKTDVKGVAGGVVNKGLGVTIYYMVYDRQGGGDTRGTRGDVFGTGIKDFDTAFNAGRGSDLNRLDTSARYLYLYQAINDSGRESAIRFASIRLIVDPVHITSYGYYAEAKKTDKGAEIKQGLGFTAGFSDPKGGESVIRLLSSDSPGVGDFRYRSPAPAIQARRPWGFQTMGLNQLVRVAGEDIGREPAGVVLVRDADFPFGTEEASSSTTTGIRLSGVEGDVVGGAGASDRGASGTSTRRRWSAIRAYWPNSDLLQPKQRSTIFGFTSNLPPVLREVAVGGRALGIGFAEGKDDKDKETPEARARRESEDRDLAITPAGGVVPAASAVAPAGGTVPTPAPAAREIATVSGDLGGTASTGGGLGAISSGGGGLSGGGGIGGGAGGGSPFLGGGNGGGRGGGGIGGGSGSGGGIGGGSSGSSGGGIGGGVGGNGSGSGTGKGDQDQGQDQNQKGAVNVNVTNNITAKGGNAKSSSNSSSKASAAAIAAAIAKAQANAKSSSKGGGGGKTPDGNVIPAPPAWLLGLLGLPAFAFLARRRNKAAAATEAAQQEQATDEPAKPDSV